MKSGVDKVRAEYWRKHIKRWEGSSLSQAKYCRENRLSESSFSGWRRKLALEPKVSQNSSQPQFIELTTPSAPTATPVLKLERGEFTIHVPTNFEASDLRRLLEILEC